MPRLTRHEPNVQIDRAGAEREVGSRSARTVLGATNIVSLRRFAPFDWVFSACAIALPPFYFGRQLVEGALGALD